MGKNWTPEDPFKSKTDKVFINYLLFHKELIPVVFFLGLFKHHTKNCKKYFFLDSFNLVFIIFL
jgi:hypothetical protein